jgi:hypothetical protein
MCTRQGRHEGVGRCEGGFPFWAFWLIWPAIWLVKGAGAALGPLLAALTHPLAMSVTPLPLPLLLIGVGLALLLLDHARGRD